MKEGFEVNTAMSSDSLEVMATGYVVYEVGLQASRRACEFELGR